MGGGKGGSDVTVGYKYYLGAHLALCHGPVDIVSRIQVDEKTACRLITRGGALAIDAPELFGGESREGGVSGTVDIEMGGSAQDANDYLAGQLGDNMPSFRGVMCAVLRHCYVGNNPYLKSWSFRAQRIFNRKTQTLTNASTPDQWYADAAATIPRQPSKGVAFSPDGKLLCATGLEGEVTIFEVTTGKRVKQIQLSGELTAPSWSANGRYIAFVTDASQDYYVIDTSDWSVVATPAITGAGYCCDFAPDGQYLAVTHSLSPYLTIIDTGSWSIVSDTPVLAGAGRGCAFAPGGDRLAVVHSNAPYITIISTASWTAITSPSLTLTPTSVAWSPDGEWLAISRTYLFTGYTGFYAVSGSGYDWVTTISYGQKPKSSAFTKDGRHFIVVGEAGEGIVVIKKIHKKVFTWLSNSWSEVDDFSNLHLADVYPPIFNMGHWVDASETHIAVAKPGLIGIALYRASDLTLAQRDMNPAHIIRECLTDPDWGMGYADADINDDSFVDAADRLYYDEGFGLSLLWDRQVPIEEFVRDVTRHIDGALYVDRATGLFTLKLIRDDYDAESLVSLGPSNVSRIDNFSRPAIGDLVNSVTAQYWDADSGQPASTTVQDIALIHMTGDTVAETIQYPGITNGITATRVAQRDLRALSTPLVSCTLYANRDAAGLNAGHAFRLTWPEYGIADIVMRVTEIAFGDGRANAIRIRCVQDVFAMPDQVLIEPPPTEWEDPVQPPVPLDTRIADELPYLELVKRFRQKEIDAELADNPDFGMVAAGAVRQGSGVVSARIMADAGAGYSDTGSLDFCPSAVLAADVAHMTTGWTIEGGADLSEVRLGSYALIDLELVRVDAVSDTAATMGRGLLDTAPAQHAAGARIFFLEDNWGVAQAEYTYGDSVDIKLLTVSGQGTLDIDAAPVDTVDLGLRAIRPYPPGRVQIDFHYFPEVVDGTIRIDWRHRDRTQQTSGTHYDFTTSNIGPETGTTYDISLTDIDTEAVIASATGLTGTTWTPTLSLYGGYNLQLSLDSHRDGYASWQAVTHTFTYLEGALLTEADEALITEDGEFLLMEN